jgi:hypothetical protein
MTQILPGDGKVFRIAFVISQVKYGANTIEKTASFCPGDARWVGACCWTISLRSRRLGWVAHPFARLDSPFLFARVEALPERMIPPRQLTVGLIWFLGSLLGWNFGVPHSRSFGAGDHKRGAQR